MDNLIVCLELVKLSHIEKRFKTLIFLPSYQGEISHFHFRLFVYQYADICAVNFIFYPNENVDINLFVKYFKKLIKYIVKIDIRTYTKVWFHILPTSKSLNKLMLFIDTFC